MTPGWDATVCLLDGRFDEAVALCDQAVERGAEVNRQVLSLLQASFITRLPLIYMGDAERYVQVVRAYLAAAAPAPVEGSLMLAFGLTQLGRVDEARALAEDLVVGDKDLSTIVQLLLRLELANAWKLANAARTLAAQLAPVAHLGIVHGAMPSVARMLGTAAMLQGNISGARAYFELAVDRSRNIRYRPELALSRLCLAELLLDHFPRERSAAQDHLRAAAAEFEEMRMLPALERATHRGSAFRAGTFSQRPGSSSPGGLTLRECDVAALLAAGASNREIAESLVISSATVGVHVKHILNKLDFKSRAQVAVWAAERGLMQRARSNCVASEAQT